MELDSASIRFKVEQRSSLKPEPSPRSSIRPSPSITIPIPCKHSRYVPGSGPPLQPISLLPPHDSTAYIKDRILLPPAGWAANGKPLPKRMMYLVGWTDLPAATLLTPAMKVLEYVSPYALEEWEFKFEQELDEEQIRLEKEKQAEDASTETTKKRKRERPPVHSQIEAAVVAEPETIAKAKSQPKKGVLSMVTPPKKRFRDFEGLFDNEEDELSCDDYYDYGSYDEYGGGDDDIYSNDITPGEQMEQEALQGRQKGHEPEEFETAGQFPDPIKPWPLMRTVDAGKTSTPNHSTPMAFPSGIGSGASESPKPVPDPPPTVDNAATWQQQYEKSHRQQQQLLQRLLQQQQHQPQQRQQQQQQAHQGQQPQPSQPQNHQRISHLPPLRYATPNLSHSTPRIELLLPSSPPKRAYNDFSAIPAWPIRQPAETALPAQTAQTIQLVHPPQSTQSTQSRLSTVTIGQSAGKPEPEPASNPTPSANEDNQWVVERLEDVRYCEEEDHGIVRYFKVRWEGDWPADQNPTWEPEGNIPSSLVRQFMKSSKAAQSKKLEAAEAANRKKKKKKQTQMTLSWPSARKYSSVTEAFAGEEDTSPHISGRGRDSMDTEGERDEFFVVEDEEDAKQVV